MTSLHTLTRGPDDGPPVLLVHGNCSSSGYWAPLLDQLPEDLRVVAPDLRGYGQSPADPVDATRGLRDFADDVFLVLDREWPDRAVAVVGHSMGGGVAMQLVIDHPGRVSALVLEAPVSPYGFGGTRDAVGTLTSDDWAGTGAGTANPDFVRLLAAGDRGTGSPAHPRDVMRGCYVADPGSLGAYEEALLDTLLSTATGDASYPGDSVPAATWPGVGPGTSGVLNTMSPKYCDLTALTGVEPKPPVTWVRGLADVIVSDTSLFDLAYLGRLGAVPGWPGDGDCPPQPMVTQTRAVLEAYAARGGSYDEVAWEGVGHSPHVERPADFAEVLRRAIGC